LIELNQSMERAKQAIISDYRRWPHGAAIRGLVRDEFRNGVPKAMKGYVGNIERAAGQNSPAFAYGCAFMSARPNSPGFHQRLKLHKISK
jgi:hypothetical protein